MADIYGTHFEFGGVSSRKYGLVIVAAESNRYTKVSGEVGVSTIFNKRNKQRSIIHNDYSNFPVSFDVDIITDNERGIMLYDRRIIEKWLFNRRDYQKFYIDMRDDPFAETYELVNGEQKRLYLNCRFVNPLRLEYNGGIVGYKVTLEADSGMWWQDEVQTIITPKNLSVDASSNHIITVDSDIDDYIYPRITFTTGRVGGSVSITNMTDDPTRVTQFINIPTEATIVMDGSRNYINGRTRIVFEAVPNGSSYQIVQSQTSGLNSNYYEKFVRRNFIRLLDGENTLNVTGNIIRLTVEFNNRRML